MLSVDQIAFRYRAPASWISDFGRRQLTPCWLCRSRPNDRERRRQHFLIDRRSLQPIARCLSRQN